MSNRAPGAGQSVPSVTGSSPGGKPATEGPVRATARLEGIAPDGLATPGQRFLLIVKLEREKAQPGKSRPPRNLDVIVPSRGWSARAETTTIQMPWVARVRAGDDPVEVRFSCSPMRSEDTTDLRVEVMDGPDSAISEADRENMRFSRLRIRPSPPATAGRKPAP